MSGGVFLIQADGSLLELNEEPYAAEELLQGLLERYPELLGSAAAPNSSLILVKREVGVPGELDGGERWSLDHLFLDRNAVPTLVEVKRSTDTRIRREVVGQMLDYAANAVVYWPIERLRVQFEETNAAAGVHPDEALREFLVRDDVEAFWSLAKTNLQAGRIRLLFVADEIPAELRRIIEFLNEQMDPAEVLGIELRQYTGGGVQSLIPRVIGQTADSERRKGTGGTSRKWDESSFLAQLHERGQEQESRLVTEILDWARSRELRVWWGSGSTDGSFYPMYDYDGGNQYTVAVRSGTAHPYAQFQLGHMRPPFDVPDKIEELTRRLRDAANIEVAADSKYPSVRLEHLTRPGQLHGLLAVLDWVIEETEAHRVGRPEETGDSSAG